MKSIQKKKKKLWKSHTRTHNFSTVFRQNRKLIESILPLSFEVTVSWKNTLFTVTKRDGSTKNIFPLSKEMNNEKVNYFFPK